MIVHRLLQVAVDEKVVVLMVGGIDVQEILDHLRGRVVSIYMVAFRGGMPLGSLASGYAATFVGVPTVLAINGGLVVLVAAFFLARGRDIRAL